MWRLTDKKKSKGNIKQPPSENSLQYAERMQHFKNKKVNDRHIKKSAKILKINRLETQL